MQGPAKVHEIFINKPVHVRGFGFKLDGGTSQRRLIFISTIEDGNDEAQHSSVRPSSLGSPADKAGLCVDDEVLAMNDENIEQMTFDQVRRILKERNLRGSIKLLVRTYEGNTACSAPGSGPTSFDSLSLYQMWLTITVKLPSSCPHWNMFLSHHLRKLYPCRARVRRPFHRQQQVRYVC